MIQPSAQKTTPPDQSKAIASPSTAVGLPSTQRSLVALRRKINESAAHADQAICSAVKHAIECGGYLNEVKNFLPHGDFQSWLSENTELSTRTATRYMSLWRELGSSIGETNLASMREAERLIDDSHQAKRLHADGNGREVDTIDIGKGCNHEPAASSNGKSNNGSHHQATGGARATSAESSPAKRAAEPLRDSLRRPVPENLRRDFEIRGEVEELLRSNLARLRLELKELARSGEPGAVLLERVIAQVDAKFKNCADEIRDSIAFAVCVRCKGKGGGCDGCRPFTDGAGLGWITEGRFRRRLSGGGVTPEEKAEYDRQSAAAKASDSYL